jgi:hypothetical protein
MAGPVPLAKLGLLEVSENLLYLNDRDDSGVKFGAHERSEKFDFSW